jgi:hypothetical protein
VNSHFIDVVRDLFNRQSIVQVLRSDGVNRENSLLSQIASELDFLLRNPPFTCLLIYVLSEDSK